MGKGGELGVLGDEGGRRLELSYVFWCVLRCFKVKISISSDFLFVSPTVEMVGTIWI